MNKFYSLFTALVLLNQSLFGQSVTISPSDESHIRIYKHTGTAKLSIVGDGESGLSNSNGNSEISLSNHSFLGSSATNSINFNSIYSIKNIFTPNLGGHQNNFGIYHLGDPFFSHNPNANTLETVPIGISQNSSYLLNLKNSSSLNSNVESAMYFRTADWHTGAIKTIGTSVNSARMGFFTYTHGNFSNLLERMSILDDGKVGIGLISPNNILDINGRARIRHNGNTAGVWFSNSTNGLSDADGSFFGLKTDNEAGVWIGNAWRFWVNNAGTTTITGEVNRTQTSTANVVPIAYGNINVNGNIHSASTTDNVSVTKTGPGVYQITISGEAFDLLNYTAVASLNSADLFGFVSTGSEAGKLVVYTANSSGVAEDRIFTFAVYKK